MAKFVFAYTGGKAPESEEEGKAVMDAWMSWFGSLGDAVIDGGNAFGASATVTTQGVSDGGASAVTGYSIVSADSLDGAVSLAKGCPILADGGGVEVYETIDM